MINADSRKSFLSDLTWSKSIAVGTFIFLLAWLPFPLGSAISWGAGAFEMGVAACVVLWVLANLNTPLALVPDRNVLWLPISLFGAAVAWALLQSLPIVPAALTHPIWAMSRTLLNRPLTATISLNPWRTQGEILKLLGYAECTWLAYSMSREYRFASMLYNAAILIPVVYVLYAYGLVLWGLTQPQVIYGIPFPTPFVSGPFMLHNSFATYCGISALAAISRLIARSGDEIIANRGTRRFVLSLLSYSFGTGVLLLVASILLLSGVITSASRGGAAALALSLLTMASLSFFVARRAGARVASAAFAISLFLPILFFLSFNSAALTSRINDLLDAGTADSVRLELWSAARHMISSAPWEGLGLGTFQDAYPLYASKALPFVMDKAHSDYLELIAGLGIPAAATLIFAIAWMAFECLAGTFKRRRHIFFSLTGFCVSVLVAAHSFVDFSLQIPAVGALYVVLLGIGVAQARRTAPIQLSNVVG